MCEITLLSSVVYYVLGTVHRFDFWLLINRTPNKERPVDVRPCSDRETHVSENSSTFSTLLQILRGSTHVQINCIFVSNEQKRKFHQEKLMFLFQLILVFGTSSVVGIATGYGLDGPGIESRWGRDFPHLSRPALGPTQPSVQ